MQTANCPSLDPLVSFPNVFAVVLEIRIAQIALLDLVVLFPQLLLIL